MEKGILAMFLILVFTFFIPSNFKKEKATLVAGRGVILIFTIVSMAIFIFGKLY